MVYEKFGMLRDIISYDNMNKWLYLVRNNYEYRWDTRL